MNWLSDEKWYNLSIIFLLYINMCWIFAYNWKENAIPLLVEGLRNLEYRGYDSAWVFWITKNGKIFLEKAIWKVSNLNTKVEKNDLKDKKYKCWIAHTRWATHGWVTEKNTHPHYSQNKRFFVVHNGIIENYAQLREKLTQKWHEFYSDTDTEVVAKLIDDIFTGDMLQTIELVTKQLVWAYALGVIDSEEPWVLFWAKLGSPMIVWIWETGTFLSSDINAVSKVADEFITLEDCEIVRIENGKHQIFSLWKEVCRMWEKITDEFQTAEKGDFETFTEKEIHDIPLAFKNAFKWRIDFDTKTIKSETLDELGEYDIKRIEIIASGSSYFAGLTSSYWFKELSGMPCEVRISPEFLYDTFLPQEKTLYIFLSQSWETADVRESVKIVKAKGWLTFGIVNVVGSTIARMCDMWLYTHSWVEVWVASTKNIFNQLAVLLLMALNFWIKRDLQLKDARTLIWKIAELPDKFASQLENKEALTPIIDKYSHYKDFFFLGRNLMYGTAAESSLKFKELTYLHAECYAAGELKHGPLALVWPDFPCVILNPKWVLRDKTVSNIKEVRARWTTVLWVVTEWDNSDELYDDIVEFPKCHPLLSPFMPLIPMWLMAVWVAKKLWKDVDKPQNLAKSVTVE